VGALAIVAFARSLGNGFTYDEGLVIVRAQPFLQSWSLETLFSPRYFGAAQEGTWRPFCTLTYMVDAAIAMHPAVFRAQSLLWHLGAAWLLMALARRLLPPGHRPFALAAGLFFALHPITTETVDNPSFREDGLATFFTLATLWLALGARPGQRRAAVLTFVLGLLSKESAIVTPALLAVLRLARVGGDAPPERPGGRAIALELAPYLVVAAVYLAIRFGPMSIPIAYARYAGGSFLATLAGLPAIWAYYLRLILLPWPLCAEYTGFFRFGRQPIGPTLAAVGALAAFVTLLIWAARRGHRIVAFGLGWFLVALLPVSNLVPMPIPAAERFLYLPLAGLALALASGLALAAERVAARVRRTGIAVGAAILGAYLILINVRHGDWRDDETLWLATATTNPRSCGAQSAVGGNLLSKGIEKGDPALLRESAQRQELALSLCSERSDVYRAAMTHTRLGAARVLLGERDKARASLERAMRLFPTYALPVAWLGYVAYLDGNKDQAAVLLKHALIDLGPPDGTVADVARRYVDKL
jgi:protein O-mannosyl-transferase